ncbi:hypothetical protein LY76DRAFT_262952 [Colletotrichum caudatum]|nr:hypothetical protein LY76DRAFT_262952 [Colletotrichum caudatum]
MLQSGFAASVNFSCVCLSYLFAPTWFRFDRTFGLQHTTREMFLAAHHVFPWFQQPQTGAYEPVDPKLLRCRLHLLPLSFRHLTSVDIEFRQALVDDTRSYGSKLPQGPSPPLDTRTSTLHDYKDCRICSQVANLPSLSLECFHIPTIIMETGFRFVRVSQLSSRVDLNMQA